MFYVIKKDKERSWQYSGWNCASAAGGPGSIPDQSTKIPHGTAPKKGEKTKSTEYLWMDISYNFVSIGLHWVPSLLLAAM